MHDTMQHVKFASNLFANAQPFQPSIITCSSSDSVILFHYFNARSVRNRLEESHAVLYCKKHNVICITETWLCSKITDVKLDPRGLFNIFRRDRALDAAAVECVSL